MWIALDRVERGDLGRGVEPLLLLGALISVTVLFLLLRFLATFVKVAKVTHEVKGTTRVWLAGTKVVALA